MVIDMNETQLKTVAQLRAFLDGTLEVQFQPIGNDAQRSVFIGAVIMCNASQRVSVPMTPGFCATMRSSAAAGPEGRLRPCSHS